MYTQHLERLAVADDRQLHALAHVLEAADQRRLVLIFDLLLQSLADARMLAPEALRFERVEHEMRKCIIVLVTTSDACYRDSRITHASRQALLRGTILTATELDIQPIAAKVTRALERVNGSPVVLSECGDLAREDGFRAVYAGPALSILMSSNMPTCRTGKAGIGPLRPGSIVLQKPRLAAHGTPDARLPGQFLPIRHEEAVGHSFFAHVSSNRTSQGQFAAMDALHNSILADVESVRDFGVGRVVDEARNQGIARSRRQEGERTVEQFGQLSTLQFDLDIAIRRGLIESSGPLFVIHHSMQ